MPTDPRIEAAAEARYNASWDDFTPDDGEEYADLHEGEKASLRAEARHILAAVDAVDPLRVSANPGVANAD